MIRHTISIVVIFIAVFCFASPLPVKRSILAPRNPAVFEVNPSIAFNTRTKQSLVVWERHPGNHPGHSTWARLLNPQGGTSGSAFSIVPGFNPYTPMAVYNPHRNGFAVVYSDERSTNGKMGIFIQRLNSRGRRSGAAVKVSVDDQFGEPINDQPSIIYHPGTQNYFIFWRRTGTTIVEGIYGAVYSANLSRVAGPQLVVPLNREQGIVRQARILDLKIHSVTQKVVMLFSLDVPGASSSTNPKANYFLAALNPDLSSIRPSGFIKINSKPVASLRGAAIEFLLDGNGVVVYIDTNNIKMRRTTPALKMTGGTQAAFRPPLNNTRLAAPALAFTQGKAGLQGVLVAVRDPANAESKGGLWMQQLDQSGKPNGSPVEIEKDFDTAAQLALIAVPGSQSSNTYRFRLVYVQGGQLNIPPTPNESSGLILLNFGFTLP